MVRRDRIAETLKLASLTQQQINMLAGEIAVLVNDEGLGLAQAVEKVVGAYRARTGRTIPSRDLEVVKSRIPQYGKRAPNPHVQQKLLNFGQTRGFSPREHQYRAIDPQEAKDIAGEYDKLPRTVSPQDPGYQALKKSYQVLRTWISRQFRDLLGDVKVEPWAGAGEPYPNSKAMRKDVRENNHLWVFTGGTQTSSHPFFTPQDNIKFRAVHDYVTHAAEGYEFGPRGEYNAWLHHASTLPPEAQLALENETVGQNFWTHFGPHMDQNPDLPIHERPFVEYPPVVPMSRRPKMSSEQKVFVERGMPLSWLS